MQKYNSKQGKEGPNNLHLKWKGRLFILVARRLYFVVSYPTTSYKLQLSYENIWQVQLRRSRGNNAKFVVIQLYGAPRIYQKQHFSIELATEGYYRETTYMKDNCPTMQHEAQSSRELEKAMAPPCIELAKLFSIAVDVDFPKTGVHIDMYFKLIILNIF
ncbi:unnamed protein product [Lactuca virosa]|uniref:RNA-dependent RNA polymerase n=1 Tax=Lactuca virosa TaxID=75947 RepID=A0AAU9N4C1_9ASTR|nr:unnamed protein product [Lactuca virosa]